MIIIGHVKKGSNQSDLIRTTFSLGRIIFTFYLRYVVCGDANTPIFVSHASFPRIPLRKRLLEIVCYISWVFGEYLVAVIEYCCQDIESERQRSPVYDCQVHSLFSPKTQTRDQRRKTLVFLCHKVPRDNYGRNLLSFIPGPLWIPILVAEWATLVK